MKTPKKMLFQLIFIGFLFNLIYVPKIIAQPTLSVQVGLNVPINNDASVVYSPGLTGILKFNYLFFEKINLGTSVGLAGFGANQREGRSLSYRTTLLNLEIFLLSNKTINPYIIGNVGYAFSDLTPVSIFEVGLGVLLKNKRDALFNISLKYGAFESYFLQSYQSFAGVGQSIVNFYRPLTINYISLNVGRTFKFRKKKRQDLGNI